MRSVVQRVSSASVTVGGQVSGKIGKGLCVLIGVEEGDTEKDAQYMGTKFGNCGFSRMKTRR